jgi:hypothetical protein
MHWALDKQGDVGISTPLEEQALTIDIVAGRIIPYRKASGVECCKQQCIHASVGIQDFAGENYIKGDVVFDVPKVGSRNKSGKS